jgi:hypothetical protein
MKLPPNVARPADRLEGRPTTSTVALPLDADHGHHHQDRVAVDLLMPQLTNCAPCRDAMEEIDHAAALLAPELAARGIRMQVRVMHHTDEVTLGRHGVALPELRINGVAIHPHGTRDCGDGGAPSCGTYQWDGATYAAPPAELLTAAIHAHLDDSDRGLDLMADPGRPGA